VAGELDSTPSGLRERDAAERLRRFGPNTLPETPARNDLEILARQFKSPLVVVLVVALVSAWRWASASTRSSSGWRSPSTH
jgi:magnesium-transporting ATPase (P-type)